MLNSIHNHATRIGDILSTQYGVVEGYDGFGAIPADKDEALAEDLTAIIAEILQAWLNAGSEREATMETLFPAMLAEVREWTN